MPPAPDSAATFLREKFQTLGVEGLGDLELLKHDDILPRLTEMAVEAGMDPREAVSLPQDFPRRLEVHGGRYACSVDLSTRTVELEAITAWKANAEHQLAQQRGRKDWYERYTTRIAKVERDYSFP